ncbi:FAD/NAD(P)-binding protein [Shumkonia mesophila]|uniref:FAD/NAD(P)-binding protein n=1 Tax=Shumkonia mesophila TaxID=2838854 RepID=UPI00293415E8|nr:FAD/NAD(P)-binding protein [Shumkonia mesophila]
MNEMTALKDPMVPAPFRIERVRKELSDTFTIDLVSAERRRPLSFLPGQFNMLYVFGVGEIPISISGDPADPETVVHTTRAVGSVTNAMWKLGVGQTIGVRGPFGTSWPVEKAEGCDVVIVTGGIGLAPLRPAIYQIMANRAAYGNVCILYGARTPEDILFRKELEKWRGQFDLQVDVTVDYATGRWAGRVGVVTKLISRGGFDPHQTVALVCGPEIMMRFAVEALAERGVPNERIYVSLERNMKCGIGFCGHCQLGGDFVCKDGPVFGFDKIAHKFAIQEL